MNEIWLSVGRHRKETKWKNKKFTWPELLQRFSQCQYTGETVKEYAAMSLDEQAPIKDVGGFVGGSIQGGRRKKGAISYRTLVTLDLDDAPADFFFEFALSYSCAACVYSTHKHTPDAPRLRLIIPLDREIFVDEYEAVSRKIADTLGMDYFDPTTFQAERLMYWPSMPKDGQFVYQVQNGPALCADDVLAEYSDWSDVSQWPIHPLEKQAVREGIKLAADPLEKPGFVGAFCRNYSIEEAIEKYLGGIYEPAGDGRYTYAGGSTAAGLVVYDDKFAYSHHGTDPASGILCNAFDLVRLHLYGRLDDRTRTDTEITKRPSFVAMVDLCRADEGVNLDLVKQQTTKAKDAFAEEIASGAADEWLQTLETDRRGKIQATADNIMIILRNDPGLAGKLQFNEFSTRYMVRGSLPWDWREIERVWGDDDDAGLRTHIETVYKFTAVNKIYDAVALTMQQNRYHPVRTYLEGTTWDGIERLDTLLIDYFGAIDNEYTRAVTRKTLVAAVARIMEPGCKFDNVLVLVGPQGAGKSTIIDRLGMDWYSDNFRGIDTKEILENIQGVWLMEIGELAGMRKAEIEVIKHFISNRVDEFRPAYGRHRIRAPRQTIFIATTNEEGFLVDPTGGRRFWPVRVGYGAAKVFREFDSKLVKLIWGEAVRAWADGEPLHLDYEIEMKAKEVQAQHMEKDPWEEPIKYYLDTLLPDGWAKMMLYDRKAFLRGDETLAPGKNQRQIVTAMEIWMECLEGDKKSLSTAIGRRISNIMRNLENWQKAEKRMKGGHNTYIGNSLQTYYQRITPTVSDDWGGL